MSEPFASDPVDALTLVDFYGAWELYATPALTGAVLGLTLGLLGVYVVLRRLVFLSAALSQAASLGVALAFFAQITWGASHLLVPSPTTLALTLTFAATLLVAGRRGRSAAWRDSALGLIFLAGSAGTLALGSRIVQEISDINALLFGSAVAVMPDDFEQLAWLCAVIVLVHALWWRGFAAVSFDLAGARVRRMPVRFLELTLFATLALAISASTRVVGALPVFALSVLPALAAARLATNLPMALVAGGFIGALAGFYGYLLAFLHDLPVGPAQTLLAVSFVAAGEAARRVPSLPLRLTPGVPRPGVARARRVARAASWVVSAGTLYLVSRPALVGVTGVESLWVAEGAQLAVIVVVALLGAWGAVAAAVVLRRPVLAVGFAVALLWLAAAALVDVDVELVRPILLASAALAVAACHREARRLAPRPPPPAP